CSAVNDRLPIGVWMLPALSTRNSTLPAFASRTARPMSNVTVPSLGFGMRPRGPSTLPSRLTCPMRSGVAMVGSKSMKPPWTFSPAASYRLLTTVLIIVSLEPFSPLASAVERPQLALRGVRRLALHDIDAHAAGGALDDPHRGVDGVRVEVHQLGLRDLAHLLLRDLADLVLVRHRRRLRDARRALEQHGRRRRLHDEGEGPVLVDGHDDRQDQPLLVAGLRVEALAELHDVDAVLAERRPHRRRRIRLAGRNLQLHHRLDFLH